jgi:hypothetical protein
VILGEADGGAAGYRAVASVVMRRAGKTNDAARVTSVILAGQGDDNPTNDQFAAVGGEKYNAAMHYPSSGSTAGCHSHGRPVGCFSRSDYSTAATVAEEHFTGRRTDTTHGATNFFAGRTPSWAQRAIDRGLWELKSPDGYRGNNWFFGPIQR